MSETTGGARTPAVTIPRWPDDAAAFADTARCPFCFTPVTVLICPVCGLDLGMPGLAPVLEAGRSILSLVGERGEQLNAVRARQAVRDAQRAERAEAERTRIEAERAAAQSALALSAPPAAPDAAGPDPQVPDAQVASPRAASTAEAAPRRRAFAHRFSMQFTILGVGVILTSVAAVVFLFWAYLVATLEVRSVIIAVGSVGVLGLAWFLRRRGLTVTGEGVGVVAIVLLLLDAWIVRANDAFGTGAVDELAYYGGAALVVAGALAGARRLTGLRVTGYAAAALAPAGIALLAAAVTPDSGTTRLWVAGLAAVAFAVPAVRMMPPSRPATVVQFESALLGLGAVVGAAQALPDLRWHALIAFGAAGVAWAGFAAVVHGGTASRWLQVTAAMAAGGSFALAPVVAAGQEATVTVGTWLAPAGAALVTMGAAAVAVRIPDRATRAAVATSAVVTTVSALPGLLFAIIRVATTASAAASGWTGTPAGLSGEFGPVVDGASAVVAPLAAAAATAGVLTAYRRAGAVPVVSTAAVAWAAVVAATYPSAPFGAAAYAAITAAAIVLAARVRGHALTVALATAEAVAAGMLLTLAFAHTALFVPAVAVFLGLALTGAGLSGRTWATRTTAVRARAIHLAIGSIVLCGSAALVPVWAAVAGIPLAEPWTSSVPWLLAGSAATLAAVVSTRRLGRTETWAASAPALASAGVGLGLVLVGAVSVPLVWLATGLLAVVCAAGVALDRRAGLRACLAAVLPVAAAVTVWHALPLLAIDEGFRWVAATAVALILTAGGLLIRLPAGRATVIALFASNTTVAGVSVVLATGSMQAWLILLLAAPIPYLMAAASGEPTASTSPWRHLAWLTPVLGLGAVWTVIGTTGTGAVEAYTVPTAALILAVAVLLAFRRPTASAGSIDLPPRTTAAGRTALVWAGAAVAILPSAASSAEPLIRPVLTACAGVLLLALSPWCAQMWRGIPVRLVVVTTGGVAVVASATVRGVAIALHGDWSADLWAAMALAAGIAAAMLAVRIAAVPVRIAGSGAAAAIVASALAPAVLCTHPSLPMLLLLAPVAALGATLVGTSLPSLRPLDDAPARWAALASVLGVGTVTAVLSGIDPFDPVPLLVGAAMVCAGLLGSRAALVWAGAAVTTIPSVAASSDPAIRAVIVVAAGAAVLAVSGLIPRTVRRVPLRMIALSAAAAALIGGAGMRGLAVATDPSLAVPEPWAGQPWAANVWAAVALAGGLASALLLQRRTDAPEFVAPWVASSAIAVATMPALVLSLRAAQPLSVLLPPLFVLAALRVLVAIPHSRPWSHPVVGGTTVAASVVVGVATIAVGGIDPFDIVTLVVGLSVLLGGMLSGRAYAVWGGAAIAVVPSVLASDGPALRPLLLAGAGILLTIALPWIPRIFRSVPLRLIAVCTAVAAATGAATVHALSLAGAGAAGEPGEVAPGLTVPWYAGAETWAVVALVVGLVAVVRRQRHTETHPWTDAALSASVIVVSSLPAAFLAGAARPAVWAIAPLLLLGVVHVLSAVPGLRPLAHPLAAWTSLGTLVAIGALTLLGGAVDPFDLVTATVGAALIAAGALRMHLSPALRSWPALGPGLLVLLVPSMLADYSDPTTWRLVTVGAVALATMVYGALARLQAPFLVGAAVLAVHGITQLWPVIAQAYGQVWWWLWLAIAGVLLIAIAATYERQLRLAKRVIRTVASLR